MWNERQSSNRGYNSRSERRYDKPPLQEDTIKNETVQVERKTFVFTLKENPRGRFLRISEEAQGRRNSIIIPVTGLEDFRKIVESMTKDSAAPPAS